MDTPATLLLGADKLRVTFGVRWFGVVHVRGSFSRVAGTVTVPGSDGQAASVSVEVDSTSVRTGISLRDLHLRGLRFLDSVRHPVIRFESERVERHNGVWDVRGRLSLRGLERSVSASVAEDQASASDRRLTAEFTVPRRPHAIGTARGIRRLNPLLWAIGDEVSLRVEMLVPATMLLPAAEHARARSPANLSQPPHPLPHR
jgi:polyisoprenoid-binding protein YceI